MERVSLTAALLGQYAGVTLAAVVLAVVAQIDYLYAVKAKVKLLGQLGYTLVVAEQYRATYTLVLCLHGGLEHCGVYAFGEDNALRVLAGRVIQLLGELALLPKHFAQMVLVGFPVSYRLTRHAALYCSLGHRCRHLGDKARIYGFGYEIRRAESEVVNLIYVVNDVGHWLLSESGNGVYGGHLHLLVYGCGVHVKCAAEDIRETYYVVYLVWIV